MTKPVAEHVVSPCVPEQASDLGTGNGKRTDRIGMVFRPAFRSPEASACRQLSQHIDVASLTSMANTQQDERTNLCSRTSDGVSDLLTDLEMQMQSLHAKRRLT